MTALPQEKRLTYYADLLEYPEGERWELYDGIPVALASPTTIHQRISGAIFNQLYNYLTGKKCQVFAAPLDVLLFETPGEDLDRADNVHQPDLMVVCDRSKITDRAIVGAPDLCVEILSPATQRYDRVWKFNNYARAGVREYWIVDPSAQAVQVFTLEGNHYAAADFYGPGDKVKVAVLENCVVDLGPVFAE